MTVVTGNAVAELVAVLLLPLLIFLDLEWCIEQPLSSLFFCWPGLEQFLSHPQCQKVVVEISIFGCICVKQLRLQGTWKGLEWLKKIEVALREITPQRNAELVKASQPSGRLGFCVGAELPSSDMFL